MSTNKILLVLIFISFIVLAFALKNRSDFIRDSINKIETENNISATSTIRKISEDGDSKTEISNETYTVKKDDTLWDIAERKYGSGFLYHKIIEKNPGKTFKFSDGRNGLIYEGTVLKL